MKRTRKDMVNNLNRFIKKKYDILATKKTIESLKKVNKNEVNNNIVVYNNFHRKNNESIKLLDNIFMLESEFADLEIKQEFKNHPEDDTNLVCDIQNMAEINIKTWTY